MTDAKTLCITLKYSSKHRTTSTPFFILLLLRFWFFSSIFPLWFCFVFVHLRFSVLLRPSSSFCFVPLRLQFHTIAVSDFKSYNSISLSIWIQTSFHSSSVLFVCYNTHEGWGLVCANLWICAPCPNLCTKLLKWLWIIDILLLYLYMRSHHVIKSEYFIHFFCWLVLGLGLTIFCYLVKTWVDIFVAAYY